MRVSKNLALVVALVTMTCGRLASANVTITDFSNFNLDGLFANWGTATVTSGPTSYDIISQGYGSGYKDINPNINATGTVNIQLTVTLDSAGVSGPVGGPIVSLVDGDGTFVNYAWFGQEAGTHVLTLPLASPSWESAAGSVPGLDLSTLDFFHLQNDPGGFTGNYLISFDDLTLTVPEPASIAVAFTGLLGLGMLGRRMAG